MRNPAFAGGAIYRRSIRRGSIVINDTPIDNVAVQGSGVFADRFDERAVLKNNIVACSGTAALFECGAFNDQNPPVINVQRRLSEDGGTKYAGIYLDETGLNGTISVVTRCSWHDAADNLRAL